MKFNKTLAAALLLTVTLTGCDNMVSNENTTDDNSPVVEENKAETTETEETVEDKAGEESAESETDTKEAATEDKAEDETETTDEEATEETKDTSNLSTEEKIAALEQSIFDNRSSARAVELLFELSPETANENADVLNQLLEDSNSLLEKAQTALDELKAE
ncbi:MULTISPECIES: hypothetical protein [Anaerococcus]|uniref:Lipoprotein n=1 Tax=Anaerococcus cruorum TaxID=3115617 RepID=A0ABW9MTW6_9FIRM